MTERKKMWTPGPWFSRSWAGEEWPQKRISVGPDDGRNAWSVAISPQHADTKKVKANFDLIAVAPELVDVAELLRHLADVGRAQLDDDEERQLDAVLAKAYGEPRS